VSSEPSILMSPQSFWFMLDIELIIKPLSIGPTSIPVKSAQLPALPVVRLSLLIALPTSAVSANLLEEELPELVIGSTLLSPTIPKTQDGVADPSLGSRKEKEDKEMEVAHLEYGSGTLGGGRAGWVRKGDQWVIEGLEDCMCGTSLD
jgi:hypothetical protein